MLTDTTAAPQPLRLHPGSVVGKLSAEFCRTLASSEASCRAAIEQRWPDQAPDVTRLPKAWHWLETVTPHAVILAIETALVCVYREAVKMHFAAAGAEAHWSGVPRTRKQWIQHRELLREHLSSDAFAPSAHDWWFTGQADADFTTLGQLIGQLQDTLHQSWPKAVKTDWFSALYLIAVPDQMRKSLGEFYTDRSIVEYILDCIGYTPRDPKLLQRRLVDLSCGSGSFLISALERFIRTAGHDRAAPLERLLHDRLLCGCDVNPFACTAARLRFLDAVSNLVPGLNDCPALRQALHRLPIDHRNGLLDAAAQRAGDHSPAYDFVVGNPPYVRIQRLSHDANKPYYLDAYESASGRFDLYVLFIERGLRLLKPGGRLGYITSNKFMTTAAGTGIRKLISREAVVEHIFDFSDTKLFSAAVLPCVMVLRRCNQPADSKPPDCHYALLRERAQPQECPVVDDVLAEVRRQRQAPFRRRSMRIGRAARQVPYELRSIRCRQPAAEGASWHFLSPQERELLQHVRSVSVPLAVLAQRISCGIKTTADKVFVHPMTERFVAQAGIERELVKPYLQAPNLSRWGIHWSGTQPKRDTHVLYPHEVIDGSMRAISLSRRPGAARYLKRHEAALRRRKYVLQAGRQWYELWVPQHPALFEAAFKIVTPDLATANTFALDERGFYTGGSCFTIIPRFQERRFCLYLLGLLNSSLLEFYHQVHASTFIYAGRYRYWTSYLQSYPIVDPRTANAAGRSIFQHIVDCVEQCLQAPDEHTEQQLSELVYDLYGVSDDDRRLVADHGAVLSGRR